jgi:CelD/BcsL family acetyltransferase involved in cellulose biosynthesis
VPQQAISDHYLRLPGSWEAFKTALPRNIKESLRKCYNSLKRDGHAFELRVVTRPAEVPAALDLFFALHGLRAGAAEMQAHKNVFEDPRAQAFLRDFATTLAERDELRLFQLCVAGRVVATRIGFLAGPELYLYYSGYDVAWGKYSVMTTTTAEAIQWAIAERLGIVNLSLGSDVSKLRWRPEELPYEQLVEVSPTLRGRIAYSLFDGVGRQLRAGGVRAALAAKLRPRPVETPAASLQEST